METLSCRFTDGLLTRNTLNAPVFAAVTETEIETAIDLNREMLAGRLISIPYKTQQAETYFDGYRFLHGKTSFGSCYPSALVAAWDCVSPETVPEQLLSPNYYITQFNYALSTQSPLTGGQRFSEYYLKQQKQFNVRDRLRVQSRREFETAFSSLDEFEAIIVFLSLHFPEHRGAQGVDGDRDTHAMYCKRYDNESVLLLGDMIPFGGFMRLYDSFDLDVLENNALVVPTDHLIGVLNETLDKPTSTPYGRMLANTNLHRGKQIGMMDKNCSIIRFNRSSVKEGE